MQDAHFSNIRNQIVPLLDAAESSISVAMAWFTNADLFEALVRGAQRGVLVELILLDDVTNFMYFAPDFNQLIQHGGKVWIAGSDTGFLHHKFCIIDNHIIITGSYNWTYYAETRNLENIVISDDSRTVNLFALEFSHLKSLFAKADKCPRLSWEEIGAREDVDFKELNFEIDRICKAQNLPEIKVFKTSTVVRVVETKLTPFARYDIGIRALDENDNLGLLCFINAGCRLPFTSETATLFFDSKNENSLPCVFLCGEKELKEADLMQIVGGIREVALKIQFTMTLDTYGSLRVEVYCPSSSKALVVDAFDDNLVRYE